MQIKDGSIFHVYFGQTFSGEINNVHLSIIFSLQGINNAVFVIPLTSPKRKHFKTMQSFECRNPKDVKYTRLYYIMQTDSIALFDQIKILSINRLKHPYRINKEAVIISNDELTKIKVRLIKYIKSILYK